MRPILDAARFAGRLIILNRPGRVGSPIRACASRTIVSAVD